LNARILAISQLQGVIVPQHSSDRVHGFLYQDHGERDARALTFTTLIVANLCLILTNRSWTRTILGSLGFPIRRCGGDRGTLLFLWTGFFTSFLQDLFKFDRSIPPTSGCA
jgi:Ca2+-transporting ATPase